MTEFSAVIDDSEVNAFLAEASKGLRDYKERRKLVRAIALRFVEVVVPYTPVETGRARAGWTAIFGRGLAGIGSILRVGGTSSKARAEGRRASSYRERRAGAGLAEAEVHNGVNYIEFLEQGSSLQAPAGFARRALRRIRPDFSKLAERDLLAALRLANIRARQAVGMRQGRITVKGSGVRRHI